MPHPIDVALHAMWVIAALLERTDTLTNYNPVCPIEVTAQWIAHTIYIGGLSTW